MGTHPNHDCLFIGYCRVLLALKHKAFLPKSPPYGEGMGWGFLPIFYAKKYAGAIK